MLNAPHTSTRIIPVDAKTKYVMDMAKLLVLVTLRGVPSGGIPSVFQQLINYCNKVMQHTWKSRQGCLIAIIIKWICCILIKINVSNAFFHQV